MSRKLTRRGLVVAPCVGIAVIGWLLVSSHLDRADAEHAGFYETGKTINAFLKEYCHGLETAHAAGDPASVLALYSGTYRVPGRGHWVDEPAGAEGGSTVAVVEVADNADFGRDEAAAEIAGYLASLATIDATVCKIDVVEQIESADRVRLTVKYVLDGTATDGALVQDRRFYRWHLVRDGDPGLGQGWRLAHDELVSGVRVAGGGGDFEPIDPTHLGLAFVHRRDPRLDPWGAGSELAFQVIQHASGGVSAADWSGDGLPDLFFADGIAARLYRNLGPGPDGLPRFADVTQEAGLGELGAVHSGLFADLDGDGDRDLFVGRYLAANKLFLNRGDGTFEDRSAGSGLDVVVPASSATLLDYDGDGRLDLYLGVYGDARHEVPRLPFFARNGEPNRLFRNLGSRPDGGLEFADTTEESGTGNTGWTLAVAAADYDGDGWPDLAVADDFGRKVLYRNRGDGTFEDRAKAAGVLDFSGGMGLTWGDFDGDGDLDLYTSNIKSNQRWYGEDMTVGQYLRNVSRTRWAVLDVGEYMALMDLLGSDWHGLGQQIGEGNSLFENAGDGTFVERHDSQTYQAGWGWSVAFFDYDNDADLDLYAANGWITNTPDTDL